jgi:hypothetical protein
MADVAKTFDSITGSEFLRFALQQNQQLQRPPMGESLTVIGTIA